MHIKCPCCETIIEIDIPMLKEEPCIIADSVTEYREAIKIICRSYLNKNPDTDKRELFKRCRTTMCVNPNHITFVKERCIRKYRT